MDGAEMLEELVDTPRRGTMGMLQKVRYTHEALIDMIIAHPEATQNDLAAYFGYTAAWVSNIMASDAFKEQMTKRRVEIIDPSLRDLVEKRFEALSLKSLEVLMHKLEAPKVSDNVALRAAELGARSLGFGQAAPPPAPQVSGNHLEQLAERLVSLQSRVRRRVDSGNIEDAEVIEGRGCAVGAEAADRGDADKAAVSVGD